MGFLQEFEKTLAEKCFQNEPPFCSAACPFHLDVKDLVKKWQKGRFNAAYRTYQNMVGFPGIVAALCPHPCESACLRCQRDGERASARTDGAPAPASEDGAVSLHLLEQATLIHAGRKKPNAYNMPLKDKKVAIVGGGMSGLACALFLCNKKYQVTLFEKSGRLGGRLWQELEPEIFLSDIENQFRFESYELHLNTEVLSLDPLAKFDAVYLATGAEGNTFGLSDHPEGAFATSREGVFWGGAMKGRNSIEAIADGLFASHAVERYLKTGLMNQPPEPQGTKLCLGTDRLSDQPAVWPADGVGYTEEEAAAEARRCVLCACDACMKSCDLMRLYEKTPRRIYEEVYITIHPGTLSRDGTWATRLITTCNQCGVCKQACPQKIDIGDFFLQAHRAMHDKGAMPWAFHDYWLRDLHFSNGEAAILVRGPQCGEKPQYLFFPGCQMGASEPEYVKRSFAWLLEKCPQTALWVHCCGAPAEWAGDQALHREEIAAIREQWEELGRPPFVFGCATCRQMFAKYLPEIPGLFLYEKMAEWGLASSASGTAGGLQASTSGTAGGLQASASGTAGGLQAPASGTEAELPTVPCSVFDPCASRAFPALQESVRTLAGQMSVALEPLEHEREEARCCSFGGHTSIAAGRYSYEVARDRLRESENPYITYCVNCRDTFASQRKPVYHILDLLFGLHGADRVPPALTERWENRRSLKCDLAKEYLGESLERRAPMTLYMEEELRRQLSREMILESDMEETIAWCEETGRKLKNAAGHFVGHKKLQNMTYWAEYLPEGDGYRLFTGYAHRMCLEDDVK